MPEMRITSIHVRDEENCQGPLDHFSRKRPTVEVETLLKELNYYSDAAF